MSKQNKSHNRWWAIIDGSRVIRNYPLDVDPNTLPHNTHLWTRGHGPFTPEKYQRWLEYVGPHLHRPKTVEHRRAMSDASIGVPKSETHKKSMSITHTLRIQRVRQLMSEQPHLTFHQASSLEAQLRKKSTTK